jgi:6-pyruvoyltetrahydropterin/6-carboxytetrahydropterin synthase
VTEPVRVTRAIDFSASLRYWRGDLSERENRRLFGRAADQHGHNYRLEVTVTGEPDSITGMVINLAELKELLEREILARFDHRDLNADTPYFEKLPPTPEVLAGVIHGILKESLPEGSLHRTRLYQEEDLFVDVVGEGS